jgi:hypothetical protein
MNHPAAHHRGQRAPALDQASRRQAWRRLAEAARALAQRAIDTDGRETVEARDLAHLIAGVGKQRFDVEGDSAQGAATSFIVLANAMLRAGYERRRAILAPVLLAAATAIDALLTEQGHAEAAHSRRVSGERPDSD